MPAAIPIAHTAFALLALRTLGLYTDGPPSVHDYFWDAASLALASLVVALHTLRWWRLGPCTMEVAMPSAPTLPSVQPSPVGVHAEASSLEAPIGQLKQAMFASSTYFGYLFPCRKVAEMLLENNPRRTLVVTTHFGLYHAILKIRHFVLAHGLAAGMATYALIEGEALLHGALVQAIGPMWLLLCWCIWMYCSCWLVLAACMVLRAPHMHA